MHQRLKHYNSSPLFIACSATMSNVQHPAIRTGWLVVTWQTILVQSTVNMCSWEAGDFFRKLVALEEGWNCRCLITVIDSVIGCNWMCSTTLSMNSKSVPGVWWSGGEDVCVVDEDTAGRGDRQPPGLQCTHTAHLEPLSFYLLFSTSGRVWKGARLTASARSLGFTLIV